MIAKSSLVVAYRGSLLLLTGSMGLFVPTSLSDEGVDIVEARNSERTKINLSTALLVVQRILFTGLGFGLA